MVGMMAEMRVGWKAVRTVVTKAEKMAEMTVAWKAEKWAVLKAASMVAKWGKMLVGCLDEMKVVYLAELKAGC